MSDFKSRSLLIQNLRSRWEAGGVWAGVARPNTPHSYLKCVTPIIIILSLLTGACQASRGENSGSGDLTVFAAASLTEAFTELAGAFEAQHPSAHVILNFAGSQQLAQQLAQGAPADVFASADHRQMQVAVEADRIQPDQPAPFAHNRLVVVLPESNPAGLTHLKDLAKPGVHLVLAVEQVPVGHYAQSFLTKAGQDPTLGETFKSAALNNVVSYEENVKAVLTKIVLGEADAGIVYTSDLTNGNPKKLNHLEIPDDLNMAASYMIAATQDSHNPDMAQAFIEFTRSPKGQEILSKHGFFPFEEQ